MRLLYTFGIRLYWFVAILLYPFNEKAKKWVFGRLNWRDKLPNKSQKKRVWFHCASLGEFEMARPTIEKLVSDDVDLVLSFYSPSGYEIRKNYELASHTFYLPIDTPINAKDLLENLQPNLIILVKYDVWPNLLNAARARNIPTALISALFRDDQIYFKGWGGFFRKALKSFHKIFVQNENSKALLQNINIDCEVAGDVRFDRAVEVLNSNFKDEFIEAFVQGKKTLIFGSTYNIEHHWLKHIIPELIKSNDDLRIIIAPHQVDSEHLHEVKAHFPNAYYYSKHKQVNPKFDSRVLIIDTIGILTYLYRFGNLAYIGGGFEKSLHNSLEAAVYGIPVIVGPNHLKFPEVEELINQGGFLQVNNQAEFKEILKAFNTNNLLVAEKGKLNAEFVQKRAGATLKITQALKEFLNSQ